MSRVEISSARICPDCSNLVTTEEKCPLCNCPTAPHPERAETEGYCLECAKGPFPAAKLHVITWHEDPYMQLDDGSLIYCCEACAKKREREAAQ